MNSTDTPQPNQAGFAPTRWTLILRARGDSPAARAALSLLCETYYAPVLAFLRGGGHPEDSARELTQEFFARLLARHGLDFVDPGRGRFRSFLLGAVKHFLADQHDRAHAAKRGGGQPALSLDTGAPTDTTAQLQIPDPAAPPSDAVFDREWAETLVAHAVDQLAAEFAAAAKADQFETLKPWLLGQVDSLSQADAAQRLGLTEGAVKVAIHRLRKRFRELVKAEIAQTVADPSQIQNELTYLIEVLLGSDLHIPHSLDSPSAANAPRS